MLHNYNLPNSVLIRNVITAIVSSLTLNVLLSAVPELQTKVRKDFTITEAPTTTL